LAVLAGKKLGDKKFVSTFLGDENFYTFFIKNILDLLHYAFNWATPGLGTAS